MNASKLASCIGNNCRNFSNATDNIRQRPANPIQLLLTIAGCMGIIPNIILVIGFYTKKSFKKPTYCLLANLAVSDMILSLGSLSNVIVNSLEASASIQTLIMISNERYLAIFRPTSELTRKKANFLCLIAWIISLSISFPFIITTSVTNVIPKQCVAFEKFTNWTAIIFVVIFIFQFALPTVVIITLYSLILHRLRKTVQGQTDSSKSKKLKRRTIYMLLTTTIIFLAFSTPWAISLAIMAITRSLPAKIVVDPNYPIAGGIVRISRFVVPFTAIYNPIIYCIFNKHIRQLYFSCCFNFIKNSAVVPSVYTNSDNGQIDTVNSTAAANSNTIIVSNTAAGIVANSTTTEFADLNTTATADLNSTVVQKYISKDNEAMSTD
ncbi:uncharacterized protein TRIADDRAFT_58780 [Trichoplax adhaerens]|uniref:G-protein coupled receptors family 1 profile domain-containing protein n=1 Tax=Trichoplax adhaerens TaxID=10228 RepID=B3S3M8_TRIAD|nr:hypothetical protein TRIADDRAFT_58780 [Trichoplax adhaerens]EDV22832.1 hypothetical protein TRIADDRAFT_58780 [Trichoplax adhaerens]|eukprot:XP_002114698.1 hypothetical protein TRIADDRAFT_58780 [Trichoplax adhaerens]